MHITKDDLGALALGTVVSIIFFTLTVNGWWA